MNRTIRLIELCARTLFTAALFTCCAFAHAAVSLQKFSAVATSRASAVKAPPAPKAPKTNTAASTTNPIHLFGDGFDGPWVEPAGRMKFALIAYPNIPGSHMISRDVRMLAALAGHGTDLEPETPWPYTSAVPVIKNVPRGGYVASQFACANDGKAVTFGLSTYGSNPEHPIEVSIGPQPGMFASPAMNLGKFGPGAVIYKLVVYPKTNGFPCVPGETYYINWRWTTTSGAVPQYFDIAMTFGWSPNP